VTKTKRGQDPRQGGPRSSCALAYAALPHDLVEDTRLTSTDVRVAAELLKYARNKDHAWPCAETIGKAIGLGKRAVQLSLARLEATGWIERVWRYRTTTSGRPRRVRVIVLRWRSDPLFNPPPKRATDCTAEMSGFAPRVAQTVALESENRVVEGDVRNENAENSPISQRFDSEPPSLAALPELAEGNPAAAPVEALSEPAEAPVAPPAQRPTPTPIAAAPALLALPGPAPRPAAVEPPRSFDEMASRILRPPVPAPASCQGPAVDLEGIIAARFGDASRPRVAALSPGKRAELVACYLADAGERKVFWAEAAAAVRHDPRPPVPGKDATLEELIASLRQHSGDFGLAARTAAAIRDTLGDRTGYRWLVTTLQGIQDRALDPEAVIGPLLRTLKAVEAPGSNVKNPAAYFNRALQNEIGQREAKRQSMSGS
jgi:hypothetical protein